ncbi:MAG: hypothetical protein ACYCPS_04105 [Candidatus Saccharimonadales bacterium]
MSIDIELAPEAAASSPEVTDEKLRTLGLLATSGLSSVVTVPPDAPVKVSPTTRVYLFLN